MRIAITGASGFLGGVIVSYLADRGHKIYAHENKTPIPASIRVKISEVICGDLTLPEIQKKLLRKVEVLCHAAAYIPSNIRDLAERKKCFTVNTLLTQDLVLKCKELAIDKFIFLSTANFYEPQGEKGATEKDFVNVNLAGCIPYFLSKYAAELSVKSILQERNYVILRVSTPFGIGEPLSKVVPSFIRCAKKNMPIIISGTGEENINLVYSEDVAKAVDLSVTGDGFGIFNISSASITVLDLARKCLRASGEQNGEILALKTPNIFSFSKINNDLAKFELNWNPLDLDIALDKYSVLIGEAGL